jgi:hypothetical protein
MSGDHAQHGDRAENIKGRKISVLLARLFGKPA